MKINTALARQLIQIQFPQWGHLPIQPVPTSGWDNRTFRLGQDRLIRLPSAAQYAPSVLKEQHWLVKLAPYLPFLIPTPIAMGHPSRHYPWHWSVYQWLEGNTVKSTQINNATSFARDLAEFILALQQCDTTGAPAAGPDNFYRGGNLNVYNKETRQAIACVPCNTTSSIYSAIWEHALASHWQRHPVWVHGDIATGNLLLKKGKLHAVIDFGQLAIGDPACDLAPYWTFLQDDSRSVFKDALQLDSNTWNRARGWVLWKTLCAPTIDTDCQSILNGLLLEYNQRN